MLLIRKFDQFPREVSQSSHQQTAVNTVLTTVLFSIGHHTELAQQVSQEAVFVLSASLGKTDCGDKISLFVIVISFFLFFIFLPCFFALHRDRMPSAGLTQ